MVIGSDKNQAARASDARERAWHELHVAAVPLAKM